MQVFDQDILLPVQLQKMLRGKPNEDVNEGAATRPGDNVGFVQDLTPLLDKGCRTNRFNSLSEAAIGWVQSSVSAAAAAASAVPVA